MIKNNESTIELIKTKLYEEVALPDELLKEVFNKNKNYKVFMAKKRIQSLLNGYNPPEDNSVDDEFIVLIMLELIHDCIRNKLRYNQELLEYYTEDSLSTFVQKFSNQLLDLIKKEYGLMNVMNDYNYRSATNTIQALHWRGTVELIELLNNSIELKAFTKTIIKDGVIDYQKLRSLFESTVVEHNYEFIVMMQELLVVKTSMHDKYKPGSLGSIMVSIINSLKEKESKESDVIKSIQDLMPYHTDKDELIHRLSLLFGLARESSSSDELISFFIEHTQNQPYRNLHELLSLLIKDDESFFTESEKTLMIKLLRNQYETNKKKFYYEKSGFELLFLLDQANDYAIVNSFIKEFRVHTVEPKVLVMTMNHNDDYYKQLDQQELLDQLSMVIDLAAELERAINKYSFYYNYYAVKLIVETRKDLEFLGDQEFRSIKESLIKQNQVLTKRTTVSESPELLFLASKKTKKKLKAFYEELLVLYGFDDYELQRFLFCGHDSSTAFELLMDSIIN